MHSYFSSCVRSSFEILSSYYTDEFKKHDGFAFCVLFKFSLYFFRVFVARLLSSIKPGLVKKINRLPTPIAGLVSPILSLSYSFPLILRSNILFQLCKVQKCTPDIV